MTPIRHAHVLIPWPPTSNTNVRHANGAHYRTAKYKNYRNDVAVRVVAARLHVHPLTGPLKITIHACPPDKRVRDYDNAIKPILDSLAYGGMFKNDSQFKDIRILEVMATPGTCNIFVEQMGE